MVYKTSRTLCQKPASLQQVFESIKSLYSQHLLARFFTFFVALIKASRHSRLDGVSWLIQSADLRTPKHTCMPVMHFSIYGSRTNHVFHIVNLWTNLHRSLSFILHDDAPMASNYPFSNWSFWLFNMTRVRGSKHSLEWRSHRTSSIRAARSMSRSFKWISHTGSIERSSSNFDLRSGFGACQGMPSPRIPFQQPAR